MVHLAVFLLYDVLHDPRKFFAIQKRAQIMGELVPEAML